MGKIQWNNITWKRRFSYSLKYGSITDADYAHAKRVCKEFETKNLGEYHDLYVQIDTSLLASIFENLRTMSIDI